MEPQYHSRTYFKYRCVRCGHSSVARNSNIKCVCKIKRYKIIFYFYSVCNECGKQNKINISQISKKLVYSLCYKTFSLFVPCKQDEEYILGNCKNCDVSGQKVECTSQIKRSKLILSFSTKCIFCHKSEKLKAFDLSKEVFKLFCEEALLQNGTLRRVINEKD